jgi:hypothetical protein
MHTVGYLVQHQCSHNFFVHQPVVCMARQCYPNAVPTQAWWPHMRCCHCWLSHNPTHMFLCPVRYEHFTLVWANANLRHCQGASHHNKQVICTNVTAECLIATAPILGIQRAEPKQLLVSCTVFIGGTCATVKDGCRMEPLRLYLAYSRQDKNTALTIFYRSSATP